jgi:hypothetical protein
VHAPWGAARQINEIQPERPTSTELFLAHERYERLMAARHTGCEGESRGTAELRGLVAPKDVAVPCDVLCACLRVDWACEILFFIFGFSDFLSLFSGFFCAHTDIHIGKECYFRETFGVFRIHDGDTLSRRSSLWSLFVASQGRRKSKQFRPRLTHSQAFASATLPWTKPLHSPS